MKATRTSCEEHHPENDLGQRIDSFEPSQARLSKRWSLDEALQPGHNINAICSRPRRHAVAHEGIGLGRGHVLARSLLQLCHRASPNPVCLSHIASCTME